MCGIFFSCIASPDDRTATLSSALQLANAHRGPDAQRLHVVKLPWEDKILDLEFFASELQLRGTTTVVQPHIDSDGDVLCWNGEIFNGIDIQFEENDGVKLFERLKSCQSDEDVQHALVFEGPYAFVFYQHRTRKVYFARDILGRRSLLLHRPTHDEPYLLLSSVGVSEHEFSELSTNEIFCLDFNRAQDLESCIVLLPRSEIADSYATLPTINTAVPSDDCPRITSLPTIPDYLEGAVEGLLHHLNESVLRRVQSIPQRTPGQARLAVLFSGGIDSTMIAALAHRHIPIDEPIDLLNVAFENPRKIRLQQEGNKPKRSAKQSKKPMSEHVAYLVPDRVTGLQEVEEFRRLYPDRHWNFVEVNIPYTDYQAAIPIVKALLLPVKTVMDLSLGMALYFAARGIGEVENSKGERTAYTSPARVLFNGLGSDELLGGYGRHRTAYTTGGWRTAIAELQLDLDRIPTRNLGRDDRVISSHGKESRHPFLDLDVVAFLARLPVQHKMDPRLEVGLGDKMLLRLLAMKLGLTEASIRKKRAMQFGSHSARMEGEKRGDDVLH